MRQLRCSSSNEWSRSPSRWRDAMGKPWRRSGSLSLPRLLFEAMLLKPAPLCVRLCCRFRSALTSSAASGSSLPVLRASPSRGLPLEILPPQGCQLGTFRALAGRRTAATHSNQNKSTAGLSADPVKTKHCDGVKPQL